MDTKVKGIVLNSKDYKESDKLLSILSLEKGKILVVAKGVKKAKSKFKAYAQPFCFANFELTGSKNGAYVLTGVNEIENFYSLTSNINKFEYAFCILEIAEKICKENVLYPRLFLEILKSLQALTDEEINEKTVLIKFILNLLNFEGVNINLNKCTSCKSVLVGDVFLDMQTCETLCTACKNTNCVKLEKSAFSTLKIISQNDYKSFKTIKLKESFLTNCRMAVFSYMDIMQRIYWFERVFLMTNSMLFIIL